MSHRELYNLHGTGAIEHEVFQMPAQRDYWSSVTIVPCPVALCVQTVVWYEAGYVPGYRVCMRRIGGDKYDKATIRHRFIARGDAQSPILVRDECCER